MPAAIVTVGTRSIDLVTLLARALVPYSARPEAMRAHRRTISEAWTTDEPMLVDRFEAMRVAQPYIFPETITTDRGSSYLSRHFQDACRSLGISLTIAAKYTPTHKAKIERMFGTLKHQFTQYVIGYVGESPDMRGDEEIDPEQLLTLEQLQELLEDWIAVEWQNRPHQALRDPRNPALLMTPNQMVSAYREVAPELPLPMTADRYVALLPTEWRVINHYGVDIGLRVYDSQRLVALRRRRSHHRNHGGKWPFHVDPYNPMTVWLELDDEFIPLSWRSPYNDAPMADEVWRVARAIARARGDQEPTRVDLADTMWRFMVTGNRATTSRQRKREITSHLDPLAPSNQIGSARDATSEPEPQNPTHGGAPRAWPIAEPFGSTREDED